MIEAQRVVKIVPSGEVVLLAAASVAWEARSSFDPWQSGLLLIVPSNHSQNIYIFFSSTLVSSHPPSLPRRALITMAADIGNLSQLLQASLDPRQSKQGKFLF